MVWQIVGSALAFILGFIVGGMVTTSGRMTRERKIVDDVTEALVQGLADGCLDSEDARNFLQAEKYKEQLLALKAIEKARQHRRTVLL